jgi:hypothetical protein
MKASILIAFTLISLSSNAQNDSTFNKKQDTIKIGNMLIIKKQGNQYNSNSNNSYYRGRRNWNSYNKKKRNRLYGTSFNITNGKVIRIKCADTSCSAEYTREDIRKFGSQEIFEKYLKFKENIDVSTNPNLKWCIRPDCNRFVMKGKTNRVNCDCGN